MVSRYSRKRGGTITRQPGSRNVLSNVPTLPTLLQKYSELQQNYGEKEIVTPPTSPLANNANWFTMPTPIRKLKNKNASMKQRPTSNGTRKNVANVLNLQERFNRLRKMKNNIGKGVLP
jgi:hypothetical protein